MERNGLCNFGSVHHEAHFCESIFNLGQEISFKDISTFSSGGHFV